MLNKQHPIKSQVVILPKTILGVIMKQWVKKNRKLLRGAGGIAAMITCLITIYRCSNDSGSQTIAISGKGNESVQTQTNGANANQAADISGDENKINQLQSE